MSIEVQAASHGVSLLRTELGRSLNLGLEHFDLDYLTGKSAITRTAEGRGTVHFFKHQGKELVLRHYHRGGLYGKANKDQFFYTGVYRTRGFKELNILEFLRHHNLQVCRPVAARILRQGLFYRADIITEAVSNAQELHDILKLGEAPAGLWFDIGKALGKLHKLNVRHDDINVKNILVREGNEVVFIDFDKCRKQNVGNWQSANIARFYRSLIKQSNQHQPYYFAQSNWETLQSGYAEVMGQTFTD
jgi:3-deoxy-D-manno-octulosonic acid kinase